MHRYDESDQARWVPEPPGNPERGPFARDRARVLHSAGLRRLAAKTQVVGPGETLASGQHIPRTRLTHSLECAQIGREMGEALGRDPDLVETACLAHDLGHPPFGHNGETALNEVAAACGGFEGNAQNLRLLTRLEAKVLTEDGRSAGLNLTRATLDAACKYPWRRPEPVEGVTGRQPYGAYDDDLPVFEWIRQGAPAGRVSFEAQIMDWADDVAYSVHDLEDALHAGEVTLGMLRDGAERRDVCATTRAWYAPEADPAELEDVFARLVASPLWPREVDGSMSGLAALKGLTSALIGRFCRSAEVATREAYGPAPGRYGAELVVPRSSRLECAVLKGVTVHYVITREDHSANRARQRELIHDLARLIARSAPDSLEPALRPAFARAGDDAARLRVVVDQIASLTDTSAVTWHRRLGGR
ncbi:deoxyguanosinetriphosphate triphosphohydrolase-like protein [Planomonospora parontospora subsp. parontospora]|uniref:Deoxyguanosinetriphosphate triphosphohydrolase-like protein n=2 Tax=Planomonospora parontospora TaxID=58119 RepID=A0AA37BBR2_9ACTN|nr:deoxyguanosinetriphosphate triphosphohydrolase [Planomonospora parontospora]GGK44605.1 deoxyguanosinetriphosphate triphosphohydrolase-like protein [Planomonospora parontospora]GII06228.1 deoxyguanosinetriphosphate triphosphohydrolase-like protein [Planomonospora parontospora subsp. parontospora]